jgi:hypothetical protein
MLLARTHNAHVESDDGNRDQMPTVGKLTLKEHGDGLDVGKPRTYKPLPWPVSPKQEPNELEQHLKEGLRPLVDQALGTLQKSKLPTAIRVAWNDKEYFKSEHLSGGTTGHDQPKTDTDVLSAVLKDLGLGLLGGLVAAGLDYVRFEQAALQGNIPEYRPEQVGTQVQIGSLLTDLGGTGAALAYAALQWCFTNDLLFYAIAYLDDSKKPGWNDTRDGVKSLVSGKNDITWASWSLLGLLTGKGTEEHPMTFGEALVQGVLLGPMLALGLALLVEKCGLQDLAGGLLSVSLDTSVERALTRDDVIQALCIRLSIPHERAVQLIAKVAPLTGEVSGTRATGVIQMSDDLVTAFVGCSADFQQAGKNKDGKTIGHGQTTSVVCGLDVNGTSMSFQVSATMPVNQTWKDNDKKPLTQVVRDELHVSDDKYEHDLERLAVRLKTGPIDVDAEVRTSFEMQELFAKLGFQWEAGRFSLGGNAWLVTGVRRHPETGFALKLQVRF